MTHKLIVASNGHRASAERRASRVLMEVSVVVALTVAIVAVLCLIGMDRASAAGLGDTVADGDGRLAIGAVLMAVFTGLCVLTSFMLRSTLEPSARRNERGRRLG